MKTAGWFVLLVGLTAGSMASAETVIRVLQDFEGGLRDPKSLPPGIEVSVATNTPCGKGCLKITVRPEFDWRRKDAATGRAAPIDVLRLCDLGGPYLPPESDAVRMSVRVLSGAAILAVGGPVSQMGNSDVFCDPQRVDGADGDGWKTVVFSLNWRGVRNFRRPNFTVDFPRVYYTRWAQEPMYLYLVAPPGGARAAGETVLLIDQVELLARGEGRPFPEFGADRLERVQPVIDFADDADLKRVISVAHGYSYLASFEAGYRRAATNGPDRAAARAAAASPFAKEEGLAYPAPRYTRVDRGDGRHALRAEGMWAEEGAIVAVKTRADTGVNALVCELNPDFPAAKGHYAFQEAGRRMQVVDFVIFVAPSGGEFPWHAMEATEALKAALRKSGYRGPGAVFDTILTRERNPSVNTPDIREAGAFGFYTARRYVPAATWSTTVIPFSDFVCVYGQGECRDLQAGQRPLSPGGIAAVGCLVPFGSGHGVISLGRLAFAAVSGAPSGGRSFWQAPEGSGVTRFERPTGPWAIMSPDGTVPSCLK